MNIFAVNGLSLNNVLMIVSAPSTAPATGFYISATDTAPGDGNVFTINLVSPTPAGQTRFSVSGGAVIHWP